MLFKLASLPPVLDHYDDGGRLFLAELAGNPVPELIKHAADMASVSFREIDFALGVKTEMGVVGKFPIADAGNALASAVYYEKTASSLPDEMRVAAATALVGALEEFGIPVPQYLRDDMGLDLAKQASLVDVFAGMVGAKQASLEDMFATGSPLERREAALALANEGVALPVKLAHYAGTHLGSDFAYGIDCRLRHLPEEYHAPLRELQKVAHLNSTTELTEMLDDLDHDTGLILRYGIDVPDPFETVYGQRVKQASVTKRAYIEVAGRTIPSEQIEAFLQSRPESVVEAFGEDVANQLAENPVEVLTSLPEPHRMAIARMI